MLCKVMQMCVRGFGQWWYENVLQTGLVGWCSGARLRSVVAQGSGSCATLGIERWMCSCCLFAGNGGG